MHFLLETFPILAQSKIPDRGLPLHVACQVYDAGNSDQMVDTFEKMISIYPGAIFLLSGNGKMPLELLKDVTRLGGNPRNTDEAQALVIGWMKKILLGIFRSRLMDDNICHVLEFLI